MNAVEKAQFNSWRKENAALRQQLEEARSALDKIAAIEDQQFGGDWDEIEEARMIAINALIKLNTKESPNE